MEVVTGCWAEDPTGSVNSEIPVPRTAGEAPPGAVHSPSFLPTVPVFSPGRPACPNVVNHYYHVPRQCVLLICDNIWWAGGLPAGGGGAGGPVEEPPTTFQLYNGCVGGVEPTLHAPTRAAARHTRALQRRRHAAYAAAGSGSSGVSLNIAVAGAAATLNRRRYAAAR